VIIAAWCSAAGLSVALLLPLLRVLQSHFIGIDEVDHFGTQWFYWLVHRAIFDPEGGGLGGLAHTEMVFFPWGKDIYGHTGANILDAIIASPLRQLTGPVLSFNLFVLLGMVFNGWAFSRLAREFTEDRVAIWTSSFWFGCSPFILFEVVEGRPTQAIIGLLCLFMRALWRSTATARWWSAVGAGLLLAVSGYQYWFYAFFGGLAALAHGLWFTARPPAGVGRLGLLGRHALIAAVALLAAWPGAGGLATGAAGGEVAGLLDVAQWSLQRMDPVTQEGTPIGLLTWQPLIRQSMFSVMRQGQTLMLGHQRTTSWAAILLLGLYLRRPGRLPRGPVLAMGLLLGALAIGPKLLIGSSWLPNPLYVLLVKQVGFLQRLWWPGRAYVILCILGGLTGTMALVWVRSRPRRDQLVLILGITAAMGVNLYESRILPLPTWDARVPAGYRCLAHGPPGAVIELPFGWNQRHLYFQSTHGRALYGGMIENNPIFSPPEAVALRQDNSFLALMLYKTGWTKPSQTWTSAEKQALADRPFRTGSIDKGYDFLPAHKQELYDLGYRYIVLMKDAMVLPHDASDNALRVQRTRLRKYRHSLGKLAGPEVYSDRRLSIFAPWGGGSPCEGLEIEPDTALGPMPHQNPTSSVQSLGTRTVSPLLH